VGKIGHKLRRTNGTYSAAQIHAMLREAMVLTPVEFRTQHFESGLSREASHWRAHRDFTAIFPAYTRPAPPSVIALATEATAHLRIDEDRPL
jgi:hypothetical protein